MWLLHEVWCLFSIVNFEFIDWKILKRSAGFISYLGNETNKISYMEIVK